MNIHDEIHEKIDEYIKDECEDAKKYGKMAEMAEEINDDELYSIVTAIAKDEKQHKNLLEYWHDKHKEY